MRVRKSLTLIEFCLGNVYKKISFYPYCSNYFSFLIYRIIERKVSKTVCPSVHSAELVWFGDHEFAVCGLSLLVYKYMNSPNTPTHAFGTRFVPNPTHTPLFVVYWSNSPYSFPKRFWFVFVPYLTKLTTTCEYVHIHVAK